jgi:uncharacterized CHY-type Zn-finger protein
MTHRPAKNQKTLLTEAAVYCKVCRRRLTTYESRVRGVGRTCAKRLV